MGVVDGDRDVWRWSVARSMVRQYRQLEVPTILKQLPERDGELQYRIKSAAEEHERVALESELGAVWPGLGPDCVTVAHTVSRISWRHGLH